MCNSCICTKKWIQYIHVHEFIIIITKKTTTFFSQDQNKAMKQQQQQMGTNEIDGEMKTGAGGMMSLKKGPWTSAEDAALVEYVQKHGEGNWNAVKRNSGLARCGKSCRLRWANHLRPNLKKGAFSLEEERIILELHSKLGNKWARMAAQLPGRTDNEIKNYWNTRVKRRLRQGLPLYPQDIQTRTSSSYHKHNHNHGSNITQQTQNLLPTSPSLNSLTLSPPNQSNSASHQTLFDVNPHNSSTHVFSTLHTHTSPLYLSSNRYKRYRNHNVDFNLNQSSLHPQSSSPLGHYVPSPLGQSTFTQLPYISPFSLGSGVFDQNSSLQNFQQTQFKSEDGFVPSTAGGFTFSVKPELPSNQNYQTTMQFDTSSPNNETRRGMNVKRHGSGLLDDLWQESETVSCHGESRGRGSLGSDQEKGMLEGFINQWDESNSIPPSSEPGEQNNFMHEDLSNILNTMPPTMKLPLWYTNANEEFSNDQSSGVDNPGIDVQQLASSSLPITSSSWDNMPGIC